MSRTMWVVCSMLALAFSGCIGPPTTTDDMIRLDIRTTFIVTPYDGGQDGGTPYSGSPSADHEAAQLPEGTPAYDMLAALRSKLAPGHNGGAWEGDRSCRYLSCEHKDEYLVHPPGPTEGSWRTSDLYPLGDDGRVILLSPTPMRVLVSLKGDYSDTLKEHQNDPEGCPTPWMRTDHVESEGGFAAYQDDGWVWTADATVTLVVKAVCSHAVSDH